MSPTETIRERDGDGLAERRFVVTCDDCQFEDGVHGIDEARARAADHKEATGHDVFALEVPAAR